MTSLYQKYYNNHVELLKVINSQKNSIIIDNLLIPKSLINTYKISRVLDKYIVDFFEDKNNVLSPKEISDEIDKIIIQFKNEVLNSLNQEKENFRKSIETQKINFKNIFEYSGSENLYLSNIYTRFITENLGHKFEDIAHISNKVFIPEKEINLKIKGIDFIINHNGSIRYVQLKTKKDTLTGSQSTRSIDELRIHKGSIFAAALNMGKSWTLSKEKAELFNIERLAGEDFWRLIDIDYQIILSKLAKVMKEIDKELYK